MWKKLHLTIYIAMAAALVVMAVVVGMMALCVSAQTNLTGRVYHNPNIMAAMFEQEVNIDGKDRNTLTIGNDGKTLSGIFDKKAKFTLKRTK